MVENYTIAGDVSQIVAHTNTIVKDKRSLPCTTGHYRKDSKWFTTNVFSYPITPSYHMGTNIMCNTYDEEYFDVWLEHPLSCIISGPSNSGKTFFCKNVIA